LQSLNQIEHITSMGPEPSVSYRGLRLDLADDEVRSSIVRVI
jgi:hypothetical protein